MEESTIELAPTVSRSCGHLLHLPDQIVLVEGPAGTSKSRSDLTIIVSRALEYPNSRWLLTRLTRSSLTESLMVTLEGQVLPAFGEKPDGSASRDHRSSYRLSNGSQIVVVGMEDSERLFSSEWDGILVGEAIECPQQSTMNLLRGLRGTKYPHPQLILETNPGAPMHWLNQVAEPVADDLRAWAMRTRSDYRRLQVHNSRPAAAGKWKRIVTCHLDNPGYWDHAAWCWTELGAKYLKTLDLFIGFQRARMLDGRWVAASGTVFPEFSDVHIIENFEPPSDWPWFTHWDDGYLHPTAIGWQTVAPNGHIFTGDEIYGGGRTVHDWCGDYANMAKNRMIRRCLGDPHGCFATRATGRSVAAQCAEKGIRMVPWANQNKQAMVNSYRQLLVNTIRGEGRQIFIMRRCVNAIMEHQTWAFKKTKDGEIPAGDDAYVDAHNDFLDGAIGTVASGVLNYSGGGIEIL